MKQKKQNKNIDQTPMAPTKATTREKKLGKKQRTRMIEKKKKKNYKEKTKQNKQKESTNKQKPKKWGKEYVNAELIIKNQGNSKRKMVNGMTGLGTTFYYDMYIHISICLKQFLMRKLKF